MLLFAVVLIELTTEKRGRKISVVDRGYNRGMMEQCSVKAVGCQWSWGIWVKFPFKCIQMVSLVPLSSSLSGGIQGHAKFLNIDLTFSP